MRLSSTLLSLTCSLFLAHSLAIADEASVKSDEADIKTEESQISLSELEADVVFYPLAISEVFQDAKEKGITQFWPDKLNIGDFDYKEMELPARALTVGNTVADIAFLVLASDEDKAPPVHLVQQAYDAVMSLEPPEEIQEQVQSLRQQAQSGDLKSGELRDEVIRVLNEQIPVMGHVENAETRDSGMVMVATAYFRALFIGSQILGELESPTAEQLNLVKNLKDTFDYYLNYLENNLGSPFKEDTQIVKLIAALKQVQPILAQESIQHADVKKIDAVLGPIFK
jgi:hypothetical protein